MVYSKKKIRGGRRKLDNFFKRLDEYSEEFPGNDGSKYWHLHMPCSNILLDSPKTPSYIKTKTVEKIVLTVRDLINKKPNTDCFIKVVGCLCLPCLWDSQIIIFFDENYYKTFFDRKSDYQRWEELDEIITKKYITRFNILTDDLIKVKGFKEIIKNEEFTSETEIWFVGEI